MDNLWAEMRKRMSDRDKHLENVKALGINLSERERDYRIALNVKILSLRADGMPVTITADIARGDQHVANLRFMRDCAKTDYESEKDAIFSLNQDIRILENQLAREWRG